MSARWMVMSRLVFVVMASVWVLATQADAQAGGPPATVEPTGLAGLTEPDAPFDVWLRGPFGRVLGGPVDEPATAPPFGLPLDAFVRRAPLVIAADGAATAWQLSVVARSIANPAMSEVLSTYEVEFEGPDVPGPSLIVATLNVAGEASEHAWLVDVPDREPPVDGVYDVPAPDVIVESAAGSVAGVLGDGCYAYLCVESGPEPPRSTLEPLSMSVGEVPTVRLSDDSAITAWEGRLSPVGRTSGQARRASGALPDTTEAVVALAGLEPPAAGAWSLELEVTLDRERGWLRSTYRLVAD